MRLCNAYGPHCSDKGEARFTTAPDEWWCSNHLEDGFAIHLQSQRGPMPETEPIVETETAENDRFPELRIARRIGNLFEQIEDPNMKAFVLSWLTARYSTKP